MDNNFFDFFFKEFRKKNNQDILDNIKQFVDNFFKEDNDKTNILVIPALANMYQDFLYEVFIQFNSRYKFEFERYSNLYCSLLDAIECLITTSLYNKIFKFLIKNYQKESFDDLTKKYSSFLTYEHLGILEIIDQFELSSQIEKFCEIAFVKSPKEKIACVTNIINYLSRTYPKENIIILLTYTIIMSNIPHLKIHIKYSMYFRSKTSISSVEEHNLDLINKSIEMIENLENFHDMLTITDQEFKNYLDQYEKKKIINNLVSSEKEQVQHNVMMVNNVLVDLINNFSFFNLNSKKENLKYSLNSLKTIPIDKLKEKYFKELNEMSYGKIEEMQNDFKIILKLIESSNNIN